MRKIILFTVFGIKFIVLAFFYFSHSEDIPNADIMDSQAKVLHANIALAKNDEDKYNAHLKYKEFWENKMNEQFHEVVYHFTQKEKTSLIDQIHLSQKIWSQFKESHVRIYKSDSSPIDIIALSSESDLYIRRYRELRNMLDSL